MNETMFGMVPPQSKDLEKEVLGGLMMEDHWFDEINNILIVDSFYVTMHQIVFKAIKNVRLKNLRIDLPTVANELKISGDLGNTVQIGDLMSLTSAVRSTANIESHSRIIAQNFMLRELIRVSSEIIGEAYKSDADAFDVVNKAERQIQAITELTNCGEMIAADKVTVEAMNQIETNQSLYKEHGKIPVTGVPSGIEDLDLITLGWQPGDLIIIAARASQGKTAFALNVAREAAAHFRNQFMKGNKFKKVALFSLEMKASRLMMRLLSRETRIPLYELKSGSLTDDQIKKLYSQGANVLSKEGIVFDDSTGLNTWGVSAKTKKMAKKGELGLIVIDYLQLMGSKEKKGNREQEVAGISRDLKNLAQEYNIPIIALCQLSRGAETDKVIKLSHLRESGAIEQDADVVAVLYGYTEDEIKNDVSLNNRRFVKILKQRDGMLDTIELNADMSIQLFEELSGSEKALRLPPGNFRPAPEIQHYHEPKGKDEAPF